MVLESFKSYTFKSQLQLLNTCVYSSNPLLTYFKRRIMIRTVIRYGLFGLLAGFLLFGGGFLIGTDLPATAQEAVGYGAMALALSFVYFGIKHYRDVINRDAISFSKALLIGGLISLLVGLGVGIADYIYTTVINPDFAQDYLDTSLKNYEAISSGTELEAKKIELEQQMNDYGSSGFMASLMFITVLIIGVIISLVSAFLLQRKP